MRDEEILRLRGSSRVFPEVPFAKHTPATGSHTCGRQVPSPLSEVMILGLFCSVARETPSTALSSSVHRYPSMGEGQGGRSLKREREEGAEPKRKVLKLSLKPPRPSLEDTAPTVLEGELRSGVGGSCVEPTEAAPHPTSTADGGETPLPRTPKRHVYVRVLYQKSIVETLPLELMRVRHPQILIDYLLSTAMWDAS